MLWVHNGAKKLISYFSTKTYVVGTQKNRLIERVLLSTKTYVKLMGKKIFTILHTKKIVVLNLWKCLCEMLPTCVSHNICFH